MNIEIKKLSPDLIGDYLHFFDCTAFTDNKEWAGCYCVFYYMTESHEAESREYESANPGKCFNRLLAEKLIRDGRLTGYLAYADGEVAGWCNVGDKEHYTRLSREKSPELWEDSSTEEKVKSVVCFTIAPQMRRRGIASAMLQKACEDAASEGYSYIEAYPSTGDVNERSYHGPLSIYKKLGFDEYKTFNDFTIVRKFL